MQVTVLAVGREKHSSSAEQICAPIAMEKGTKTNGVGQESPNLKEVGYESPGSRVSSQAISEHPNDTEGISGALDSSAAKSSSKNDKNEVDADGNETDLTGSENVGGEEEEEEEEEEEGGSSRFMGTFYQKNGRWGAQLYKDGESIWLGSFNDREEAAKAYCRANLKFKGQLGHLNFSEDEKQFQDSLTPDEVVYLIKRHIYDTKLQKWCSDPHSPKKVVTGKNEIEGGPLIDRQYLFEKKMSPSDVGQLNRLAIPKQHAVRHFPKERLAVEFETMLTFVDTSDNNEWHFKFSYWDCSQSYVLTKGWRKFVKSKGLKGGDVVSFSRDSQMPNNKFYITVHYSESLMRDDCVQVQSGSDRLLEEKGSDDTSASNSVSTESICVPKEMVNSDEERRVDGKTDEETKLHFHGSPQLGKRKSLEDESENKSDEVIKLFGIEIARRGGGVDIDPKETEQEHNEIEVDCKARKPNGN